MKLTHKLHANDAITISLILYVGTGVATIFWFLFSNRDKEINFN